MMNAKRSYKSSYIIISIILVLALCFHVYLISEEYEIGEAEKCTSYDDKQCTDELGAVIYNITTCIKTRGSDAEVKVGLENNYYTTICQKN